MCVLNWRTAIRMMVEKVSEFCAPLPGQFLNLVITKLKYFFNVHVNHMSTIAHEFLSLKWTFKSPNADSCWNCPLIFTNACPRLFRVSPEHYPKIHLKNSVKIQNVLPKSSNIHENLMKVPKTSTKIPIWTAVAEAGVVEKGPWTLPHLGRLLYLIALELGWWHCISEDTQADGADGIREWPAFRICGFPWMSFRSRRHCRKM